MDDLPDKFHTKSELLDKINEERNLLYQSLKRIGKGLDIHHAEKSILQDGWSIKDTIAHITEWELAMIRCLNTALRGGTPNRFPFDLPEEEVDQINAEYYQRNLHKPTGQVLDEAEDAYYLIIQTMDRVTEHDLFDPQRFDWLAGKPFWPIVAANTYWHYTEHRVEFEDVLSPG